MTSTILLIATISMALCICIFLFWLTFSLYQYKLEKIGLKSFFYGLTAFWIVVIAFLFRFFILPPLSNFEEGICYGFLNIFLILGTYSFVDGAVNTFRSESDIANQKTTRWTSALLIVMIVLVIHTVIIMIHRFLDVQTFYDRIDYKAQINDSLIFVIILLALKIMLSQRREFHGGLFEKVVTNIIIAIVVMVIAGTLITTAYNPIIRSGDTFTDLSNLRLSLGILGMIVISIPFYLTFRSIKEFRQSVSKFNVN